MRIYTLWHAGDDDDAPWIVDAIDEYTVDNHGGFPPSYAEKRALSEHRELIIDVPEKAVRALFESPEVKAKVVVEEAEEGCGVHLWPSQHDLNMGSKPDTCLRCGDRKTP